MARASAFVAGMALGLVLGTAILVGHADPAEAAVKAAAEQAGVDQVDLQGAVNTTGLDPFVYLRSVGELPPLIPPKPAPLLAPVHAVWDSLAACESTSNWHANTGNGFYGGIQFDFSTWLRHGGAAFAPRADLASREQQILIAERTLAAQGWGAWPACSRRLGLR